MPINRSATFTVGQLNIIETGHNERVLINTCFEGCHFPTQPCILVPSVYESFPLALCSLLLVSPGSWREAWPGSVKRPTSFSLTGPPLVSGRSRSWAPWTCTSSANLPQSYFVRLSHTIWPTVNICVVPISPCCPQPSVCRHSRPSSCCPTPSDCEADPATRTYNTGVTGEVTGA